MKKTTLTFWFFGAIFLFSTQFILRASMLPPQGRPPAENPHPPITEQDKARVAFADLAITQLLTTPSTSKKVDASSIANQNLALNLSADCLKKIECVSANKEAVVYADSLKAQYGVLSSNLYTHVIPWSFDRFKKKPVAEKVSRSVAPQGDSVVSMPVPEVRDDEYMLHSYVRFKDLTTGKTSEWYHLDTIVTEDDKGNMQLKRFFLTPIPAVESSPLPPGVVC